MLSIRFLKNFILDDADFILEIALVQMEKKLPSKTTYKQIIEK